MLHEHTLTYAPLFIDGDPLEVAGDTVTSLSTRHEHAGDDNPHHHAPEILSGITLDVNPIPVPVPEPTPTPVRKPRGIWWGDTDDV